MINQGALPCSMLCKGCESGDLNVQKCDAGVVSRLIAKRDDLAEYDHKHSLRSK